MKTRLWHIVLLVSLLASFGVACGSDDDDNDTVANNDANNDVNNDTNNDTNNDANNDVDPVEACQAVCTEVTECAEFVAACGDDVTAQALATCNEACASDENARAQITAAGGLACAQTVPLAIDSFMLSDVCGEEPPLPEGAYAFAGREGGNSVSYSGQTARHVLINDLKSYMGRISDDIDQGNFTPAEGDVVAVLDFYFRFDGDSNGGEDFILSTEPSTLQSTYDDISTGKDLVGKIAGNDSVTDHVDWSTEFAGWNSDSIAANGGGINSPEQLILAFFSTVEANAVGRAEGEVRTDADGNQLPVYVTDKGQDIQQLVQKFLLGAIAFHQGADDYMDDDVDGKGLLADHSALVEGKSYTALEHAWDEAFGYFGAAINYADYTDEEIAASGGREAFASGYNDLNGDGSIDLLSEYNFGASANAAKRDLGSSADAPTDLTAETFEAFMAGRALLAETDGALTDAQLEELTGYRDAAILGWEKAIAATAVHYINDTLQAMNAFGTDGYIFTEHAKVWSELKGFALSFQFNPKSPVSDEDFDQLHILIGDAPVLADAGEDDINAYRADLLAARDILKEAYGFDDANMGDENGENGW